MDTATPACLGHGALHACILCMAGSPPPVLIKTRTPPPMHDHLLKWHRALINTCAGVDPAEVDAAVQARMGERELGALREYATRRAAEARREAGGDPEELQVARDALERKVRCGAGKPPAWRLCWVWFVGREALRRWPTPRSPGCLGAPWSAR